MVQTGQGDRRSQGLTDRTGDEEGPRNWDKERAERACKRTRWTMTILETNKWKLGWKTSFARNTENTEKKKKIYIYIYIYIYNIKLQEKTKCMCMCFVLFCFKKIPKLASKFTFPPSLPKDYFVPSFFFK